MKKLIILFFLATLTTFSQWDSTQWQLTSGIDGELNVLTNRVTIQGNAAGKIRIPLGSIIDFTAEQNVVEFPLSFYDTVTVGDTASRRIISTSNTLADTTYQYQIIWYTTDTIQISSGSGYASNNTFILAPATNLGFGLTDWWWFTADIPNWYYKIYGTGTASVYVKIKCRRKQ